jgi:hypothetical protein
MRGKATEIPVYFWLADPQLEASVGDIVGVRCWFDRFEFLEKGGPFKRGAETRREWCERLQPDEYDWPTADDLVAEMDQIVADTLKIDGTKSFQLEILGPTEYSEYSCSSGKTPEAKRLDQVTHQFDFSVLTILDPRKADMIHRRFFDLLLEVVRRATEYDAIDSVRVADDFCTYGGSIYRPDFTQTILRRQIELGRGILEGGKYSVLHSDGDLRKHITALTQAYSGFHPLDITSKSTLADAHEWATSLGELRRLLPEAVFFTGIPVDLLCNSEVSADELVDVVRHVIDSVGQDRLILTTTHRPYPGWSFRDFEQKVHAVKRFLRTTAHPMT